MLRTRKPRTAIAPARWSARRSSRQRRPSARRPSARWTGSRPAPAPAPAHNVRLRRSLRCPLGWRRSVRFGAVIVLPVALLLQGVGDVLWHVGLVMLGEHRVGLEHARGVERALGDDALPFAKQVLQNSLV